MIAAVVQARMSSARLPGKILRELAGRPALEYLVERLSHAGSLDTVIVATSEEASDDPVAEFAERAGLECHRGPLDDVAERFRQVASRFGLAAFVRVSADSPLLDQALVDEGVRLFRDDGWDVVTNVHPSTYPSGQSVEVVSREAFERAVERIGDAYEREHVTPHIYRNPADFKIHNFAQEEDESEIKLALDTEHDAEVLAAILGRMDRPHWTYAHDEVVEIYRGLEA